MYREGVTWQADLPRSIDDDASPIPPPKAPPSPAPAPAVPPDAYCCRACCRSNCFCFVASRWMTLGLAVRSRSKFRLRSRLKLR